MTASRPSPLRTTGALLLRRTIALAASAALLPAGRVAAQTVSGRVVHSVTGAPVDSVDVFLLADSTLAGVDSARTGRTGIFYLNAQRGGAFLIVFRKHGGKPWTAPPFVLGAEETFERQFAVSDQLLEPYQEFEVDERVEFLQRGWAPMYPLVLKNQGLEGECVVQFVVDVQGRPDMSTFKVRRGTHVLFCDAVREAVPRMTFLPARIRGIKVRQLVQQPFVFSLSK